MLLEETAVGFIGGVAIFLSLFMMMLRDYDDDNKFGYSISK